MTLAACGCLSAPAASCGWEEAGDAAQLASPGEPLASRAHRSTVSPWLEPVFWLIVFGTMLMALRFSPNAMWGIWEALFTVTSAIHR